MALFVVSVRAKKDRAYESYLTTNFFEIFEALGLHFNERRDAMRSTKHRLVQHRIISEAVDTSFGRSRGGH
jgi:hypothetical protein